jgi:hypothetical protein
MATIALVVTEGRQSVGANDALDEKCFILTMDYSEIAARNLSYAACAEF